MKPLGALLAGVIATGVVVTGLAGAARAETYPDRPIRLIVSIAAGSVTDVIMRNAANEIGPKLGQPLLFAHLPYNPDDIVPITRLFLLTEGVFVPTALGVNSVAELTTLARAKPDGLNFATLGDGSFPDLFLRWLNNQWGTKIVGIPYKGGGPAAQAMAANEVQLTRFGVGNFLALLQAGAVKALTVSSKQRSALLPDVPTDAEAGFGGYPGQGWWGLGAPKGTPPAVIAKVNAAFVETFKDPKFIRFLEKQAVVSAPTSPEEF